MTINMPSSLLTLRAYSRHRRHQSYLAIYLPVLHRAHHHHQIHVFLLIVHQTVLLFHPHHILPLLLHIHTTTHGEHITIVIPDRMSLRVRETIFNQDKSNTDPETPRQMIVIRDPKVSLN